MLDRLDRDPMLCAAELDWVAKLRLLEQYRQRDGLEWDDAKLQLIDLQYSDIRPEKGLYHRLVAGGRIQRLLDDASVEAAMHDPPEDTRAYFRGGAWRSTPSTWPPRPGTRSSSTCPGASPCSASRPSTRCAAAGRTWVTCSTAARDGGGAVRALTS